MIPISLKVVPKDLIDINSLTAMALGDLNEISGE